jgi:hypothetical protein
MLLAYAKLINWVLGAPAKPKAYQMLFAHAKLINWLTGALAKLA